MTPANGRYRGAGSYRSGLGLVVDHRRLPDLIDAEGRSHAACRTRRSRRDLLAVQGERHGQDGLQRVALGAAVRRHIRLAARDPAREVEDVGDGLRPGCRGRCRPPGSCRGSTVHLDLRRDAGLLAGVERVVDQLLEDDQRPVVRLVPGLRHQLLATAELEQPAGAERRALQGADRRHHASSHTRQRSAARQRVARPCGARSGARRWPCGSPPRSRSGRPAGRRAAGAPGPCPGSGPRARGDGSRTAPSPASRAPPPAAPSPPGTARRR